jgi:beta-glucosidase
MFGNCRLIVCTVAACFAIAGCHSDTPAPASEQQGEPQISQAGPNESAGPRINPENWPVQEPVIPRDPDMEKRITELLSRMTLEEKVGQVIQADINDVTPDQVREYNLGSVLNGGGSAPDGNLRNTPDSWLALADEFWVASTDTADGGVSIPAIWGTDAVHGHGNIVGATIFPHNIGLGAANDPDLIYEIGRVTSLEMLATGLDWTFAPTIAVVRNDRWGRTYEGYSEDPRIVAAYAPRIVEGIQGVLGTDEFLGESRMIANAKHYAGDGGTVDGIDTGDNRASEAELRDMHAAGYPPAIAAGVQTVMASFNSFHGRKMHGYREMLNDVLVERMGFDGFVVGDWNGHGLVEGCDNESCAASFNAGLDMFMAPGSWEALYWNTLEQVRSGEITQTRLNEAVARVLRVKMRAGVFAAPRPSERKHGGDWSLLGAPEHRAIAREAVRKSLVLLKNENGLLPLPANSKVLVAGNGADNIGKQCGGWTLSWQGTGNRNEHFPNGESIFDGIASAVESAGGTAVLSENGSWDGKPDVAIVVFGEDPYAETQGDRKHVNYDPEDGLELLRKFRREGIPAVSIFISGRPMWVNPELNASDAFIAAWLPGSEGGGVADLLFAGEDGNPRFDFTGRLSYSWPASAAQVEVNVGDENYNPLFAYGYGLSYKDSVSLPVLAEDPEFEVDASKSAGRFIEFGDPVGSWRMILRAEGDNAYISDARGVSRGGHLTVVPADHEIQEDTFILTWTGPASMVIDGPRANFQRDASADHVLELNYQVLETSSASVTLAMGEGGLELAEQFSAKSGKGWQTSHIRLSCFIDHGTNIGSVTEPLIISAEGSLKLQISSVRIVANAANTDCNL